MASIYKIKIINYMESGTERGLYYAGDLFLDDKKIGSFENEGDGGETTFDFESSQERLLFDDLVDRYFKKYPATLNDRDGFISDLLDLLMAERYYEKKAHQHKSFILVQARMYSRIIIDDSFDFSTSHYILPQQMDLLHLHQRIRAKEYTIFRTESDFCIE